MSVKTREETLRGRIYDAAGFLHPVDAGTDDGTWLWVMDRQTDTSSLGFTVDLRSAPVFHEYHSCI